VHSVLDSLKIRNPNARIACSGIDASSRTVASIDRASGPRLFKNRNPNARIACSEIDASSRRVASIYRACHPGHQTIETPMIGSLARRSTRLLREPHRYIAPATPRVQIMPIPRGQGRMRGDPRVFSYSRIDPSRLPLCPSHNTHATRRGSHARRSTRLLGQSHRSIAPATPRVHIIPIPGGQGRTRSDRGVFSDSRTDPSRLPPWPSHNTHDTRPGFACPTIGVEDSARVNNPTLHDSCVEMLGRADI
jgi:hypothetical protein